MLFNILYKESIDFFYPYDIVLKSSDGKWTIPKSLRVKQLSSRQNVFNFENTLVIGSVSEATAVVSRVIKIDLSGNDVYELTLEPGSIRGEFLNNEIIYATKTVTLDTGEKVSSQINARTYSVVSRIKIADGGLGYAKNTGQQIEEWRDQLGRLRNVVDSVTRQPVSKDEYAKIGVGMVDMTQTLGYKTQDELRKFNVEALNKSNAAANAYEAASNEKRILYANQEKWLQSLAGSGLSNDSLQYLSGLSSRQIGFTQNLAEGQNAFDQFTRNKGENVGESVTKAAKAHLANLSKFMKVPLSLGADGSVKDDKGHTYSTGELNNLQNTFSKNVNYEQNFSQAKAEAEKSAVYRGLTKEQKDIFDSVLENSRKIAAKESELISEHKTLPFLVNPSAFQTTDQFKRGEIQGIAGQFNAEASKLYADWRKVQLQNFQKYGQVPTAGELEANFIKQPEYQKLKEDYQLQEAAVRRRPETFAPTIPEAEGAVNAPGVAQGAVNKGAPKTPVPTEKGRHEERNAELIQKHTKGK
jgi:hypothetical protein